MIYISYDPFLVFMLYILPPTALRASHGVRSWNIVRDIWGNICANFHDEILIRHLFFAIGPAVRSIGACTVDWVVFWIQIQLLIQTFWAQRSGSAIFRIWILLICFNEFLVKFISFYFFEVQNSVQRFKSCDLSPKIAKILDQNPKTWARGKKNWCRPSKYSNFECL